VVPLTGDSPFYVILSKDGRATLIDSSANAVLGDPADGFPSSSILADKTVDDIKGMYANAPQGDPGDRRAFIYLVSHRNGTCQLLVRTEPQKAFIVLSVSVSLLVADFAGSRGYVHVEQAQPGSPGKYDVVVLNQAGQVAAEEHISYDSRSGKAMDDSGKSAGAMVDCSTSSFLRSYPDGGQYMSF